MYQFLVLLWLRRQDSNLRPVAVGFFAFVTNICDNQFCVSPRLRCPKKASGLRISSLFSTAALTAPSLHLPPVVLRLVTQRATLIILITRRSPRTCCTSREKKKAIPFGMTFSFLASCTEKDIGLKHSLSTIGQEYPPQIILP